MAYQVFVLRLFFAVGLKICNMVSQNILRTCKGKRVFLERNIRFVTALGLIKFLKQIKQQKIAEIAPCVHINTFFKRHHDQPSETRTTSDKSETARDARRVQQERDNIEIDFSLLSSLFSLAPPTFFFLLNFISFCLKVQFCDFFTFRMGIELQIR